MPTGPKGEKRPADVISNAVNIACIAAGEEEDTLEDIAALIDANEAPAKKQGPYERAAA